MAQTRECSSCGKKKPLSADYFPRAERHPDGFRLQCISCFNDKRRAVHGAPRPEKAPKPVEEKLAPVAEHRLKAQVARLSFENKQLVADLSKESRFADMQREVASIKVKGIAPRERASSKIREATALACASDWHIEEEIRLDQVAGRNRYDLKISERRMERFFEATAYSIRFNRQIFKIRDLILWLGGDIITNYLHEDNVENNLLSPVQAIAYAQASIAAGITFLLQDPELERIVIPCNDGNHGRLTDKTRSATRVENSIEWLLYTNLAREFKNERRVQFEIATGEQLYLDVYGRVVRFMHGDTMRYGGGVGGVMIPIYKALARYDTVRRADLTVIGHFHQYTSLSDLMINGSLCGFSPYSMTIGARFEPPAQAFTILDPMRFKSVSMPLWVADREDDQFTFNKDKT